MGDRCARGPHLLGFAARQPVTTSGTEPSHFAAEWAAIRHTRAMTNLPPSPYGAADDDASRSGEPGEAAPSSSTPLEEAGPPSQSGAPEPEPEPLPAAAPASPYRAADAGAPTAQPPFGAPQQPSNLGQFYPQTPPPYGHFTPAPGPYGSYPQNPVQNGSGPLNQAQFGYAPGPSGPPKRGNGLGLTSLIIGIASMLIAITPPSSFGTFLLGFVGVVFGIIGLALPGRPRRQATWGLILSGLSMVLGIVLTFVYGFAGVLGFNGSADQPPRDEPTASASPTPQSFGAPLGTDFPLTDTNETVIFTAKVTASVLDANHLVLPVEGNSPAPEGMQWAMATVDVTRLAVSTLEPSGLTVEYVSDGELYTAKDPVAAAPSDELSAVAEGLEIGATASGSVVVAIPSGSSAGSWRLQCHDSLSGGGAFYSEAE